MDVTVEIMGNEIKIIDDADGMIFVDCGQAQKLQGQLADAMNTMNKRRKTMTQSLATRGTSRTHYSLQIIPAIEPEIRHKIEDLLVAEGFDVIGGGQSVDMSGADISFEGRKT